MTDECHHPIISKPLIDNGNKILNEWTLSLEFSLSEKCVIPQLRDTERPAGFSEIVPDRMIASVLLSFRLSSKEGYDTTFSLFVKWTYLRHSNWKWFFNLKNYRYFFYYKKIFHCWFKIYLPVEFQIINFYTAKGVQVFSPYTEPKGKGPVRFVPVRVALYAAMSKVSRQSLYSFTRCSSLVSCLLFSYGHS